MGEACPGDDRNQELSSGRDYAQPSQFSTRLGHDGRLLSWFALRVRARCEGSVADALQSKGFEVFSPRVQSRAARWQPAFPGYLFARFTPRVKAAILATAGVSYILSCGGLIAPVPDAEIDAVRRALDAGAMPVPAAEFEAGQRVRVERGPLAGVEGELVRDRGGLQVAISLLQRAVRVKIPFEDLTPCP